VASRYLGIGEIRDARRRIGGVVRKTPLIYSQFFSEVAGGDVYLKLENLQVTGAFKIRGALYKMLKLTDEERRRGVVTASSGNHAQGVAYAARMLGIKALIIVPKNTPKVKIDAIKSYGVELMVHGDYYDEAEAKAREFEREAGMVYVSPYNDADVIAGQGTIGLEILEELPDADVIIAPVGGGGLISGVAIAAKSVNPEIGVIGVQSSASPVMYECIKAGKIIKVENLGESIAEGLHGGIEDGSITFDIVREYVDEILLVGEDEIKEAIRLFLEHHHQVAEGSGAVGLAALLRYKGRFANRKTVVIVSGGNIDLELLKSILCG